MTIINIIYNRLRRRKIVACAALTTVCCITILQSDLTQELYWYGNISCHYSEINDGLLSANELSPASRSIFFHETSCQGTLNSRQACSVESAARAHPTWQIHVLFSGPISEITLTEGTLKELQNFKNVKFSRVHIGKFSKDTPIEGLILGGALNRSRWRVEHTSDVLRYLTLYKWGGVYMDLDVVIARGFGSLARNWAARERDDAIAAGVLAFSRDDVGRKVAEAALNDIRSKYRGDDWVNNGPGVITRVLKELCTTSDPSIMSAATCNGFEVYGPQFFYPIDWENARVYFKPGELSEQNAYTYHVWNHITKDYKVMKGSPYAKLARRYCPTIYNLYGKAFGT